MDFLTKIIQELNEVQHAAVTDVIGPKMIIAGAGSGKTRVLTYRLAFILDQGIEDADPQNLLALTFTNKAAKEMKERIIKLIGPKAKGIQMGTFHSVFARLLRAHAEKLGFTNSFTIYDDDDCLSLIRTIMKELNYDNKVMKERNVLNFIGRAKNVLFNAAECKKIVADEFSDKAQKIYAIYEERAKKANAMDFGDLLMKPVELFKKHPEILASYQRFFKFIMIDEYQDTNGAQYELTKMLAANHHNICVVGDDAQSIYAFRGANIQNILGFEKEYKGNPNFRTYKLEQNYRSTSVIVSAANTVISNNRDQIKKNTFTQNELGDLIDVIEADSEQDEAKRVCDDIRANKQIKNYFNKDFAILYRTNAQSRAMEDSLRRAGLKYKVFGGTSFYKRKEIKDIVAYLRLAINPTDEQALVRVINYPTRGISDATVKSLTDFAAKNNISVWEAMDKTNEVGLANRAGNSVREFKKVIIRPCQEKAQTADAYESLKFIATHSGILKDLHADKTVEGLARWENIQELINAAKAFTESEADSTSLEAFLAEISLFAEADTDEKDDDFITLMTIHSAKGLEFKAVYLVGLEEGIFPGFNAIETRADLEEERRLFYVAVTRAEKKLTITYATSRLRYGNIQRNDPSRFLLEMDTKFLKHSKNQNVATTLPKTVPNMPNFKPVTTAQPKPQMQTPSMPNFVPTNPDKIAKGDIVIHQKFGKGTVLTREGVADNAKVTVDFEQGGQRVLLLKYAKLMII